MNKQEIIKELNARHQVFADYILRLPEEEFLQQLPGKWSAGQQLDHIFRAVRPVTLAFGFPAALLRIFFGKSNRPGRSYDELVAKYKSKLAAGGVASGRYIPAPIKVSGRMDLGKSLNTKVGKLCNEVEKYTEEQLDILILPHPLLGKLTLREMLYFTMYHVEHHLALTKRNLAA